MNIAKFSTKNSLLVNLFSFFVVIVGLIVMFKIVREAFPPVDFDIVTVSTVYPGAPAEDVEKFVTIPIEKELKGVTGIKEMNSSSEEGRSLIGITIAPDTSDKRQVVLDIRDAVDRVSGLPSGVKENPVVTELKSKERPIIQISVSGPYSEKVRRQYAETLEDLLLDIPGVASVQRYGWRDPEFWVEVDPRKLKEDHVSFNEIMDALRTRNVTLPGGQLTTPDLEYDVRVSGEFETAEEIGNVVIRANDAGNLIRIKDVAHVKEAFEDATQTARMDGERSVQMVVVKTESGDGIAVANLVKETVKDFQKTMPKGMFVSTSDDISYYTNRRLSVLKNNGLIGFVLVLLLLFLFLDPVPAVMTAAGVPVALFITLIVMYFSGITINLISMLGLIIVLGMLVDDGIIVAENVYRYYENGDSPREAAIKGTNEVVLPVLGTVLTTCAAFAPLLFMSDIIGKFIRQIPMVVIIALIASLLEAFLILPAHLSDFMEFFKHGHREKDKRKKGWFQKFLRFYRKILTAALNHRYLFILGMVGLLGFAMFLFKTQMKFIFFTREGIEEFSIRAEAPKGTPLEKMEQLMLPVEKIAAELPKSEVKNYQTIIGSISSGHSFDAGDRRGTHLAQLTVYLTSFQDRDRDYLAITREVREKLKDVKGFEKVYVFVPKPGPPVGRDISVAIRGERFEVMQEIAKKYMDYLSGVKGVSDIEDTYNAGKKQIKVTVNEEKAREYGLTVEQVGSAVRDAFQGGVATSIKPRKAEEEIDVVVRFAKDKRDSLETFQNILIENKFGKLVPLTSVADIKKTSGLFKISHLDGKRVINVEANVNNDIITSLEVNQMLKKKFTGIEKNYFGYTIKYGGEYEDQQESRANLMLSFLIALFIIFMILVAMFRSLIQPFIVMIAIPFGFVGVILAFWLHGKPLNFFALMGMIGLTGVVVNGSIVFVDFVNRLRQQGKDRRSSLLDAGELRLRPVLMTAITTVGGLIAVAYGIGGGDPFLKPMALAIVWGLIFSTWLTMIGIPCIYAAADDISHFFRKHLLKKES